MNVENYKETIKKQRYTVIEVYAEKCAGCKQVEPILPLIETKLQKVLGERNINIKKMNILNEVHFLADVESTPSFLVFDNKLGKYKTVSLKDNDPQ